MERLLPELEARILRQYEERLRQQQEAAARAVAAPGDDVTLGDGPRQVDVLDVEP